MRALFVLVLTAALSAACSSPLAPTPLAQCGAGPCQPDGPAQVRVMGAGSGVCIPQDQLLPQWEVFAPTGYRLRVTATADDAPGCEAPAGDTVTLRGYGPATVSIGESSTIYLLQSARMAQDGRACGRVRYAVEADERQQRRGSAGEAGRLVAWLMVDSGRACEGTR